MNLNINVPAWIYWWLAGLRVSSSICPVTEYINNAQKPYAMWSISEKQGEKSSFVLVSNA